MVLALRNGRISEIMDLSRERLVLYTGAGLLGGVAGWATAEPLAGIFQPYARAAALGAAVGIFIGVFVGSIEGLSAGHRNKTWAGVKSGAAAGVLGGSLGLLLAELTFEALGGMGGQILGWGIFGCAVGLGAGRGGKSIEKMRNGGIGGAIGGGIGGALFQLVAVLLPQQTAGRAIAISLLGALIGFWIGLVSEIFIRGWFMVVRSKSRNTREGREYHLTKEKSTIGRAEESDVGLFGDQSITELHAMVEKQKREFTLIRSGGEVNVNGERIDRPVLLNNGDRIEIGGTLLLFRVRDGKQ